MRRLITRVRWKRWLARRARSEATKRQRKATLARYEIARAQKNTLPAVTLIVPQRLSLIDNPDEVIGFCDTVRKVARKNHIRFDLANVTEITPDGIAVFLSTLKERAIHRTTNIWGNEPRDEAVRKFFVSCGFYSHFSRSDGKPGDSQGHIRPCYAGRESRQYQLNAITTLVDYARAKLAGTPYQWKRCYHALTEMMENTVQHASPKGKGTEPWWASVFIDEAQQRACFTFNDSGVGVFKSLRYIQQIRMFTNTLRFRDAGEQLRFVLSGQLGSRTNLDHRGQGLPAICLSSHRQAFQKLVIISNNAFADVGNQIYRQLKSSFRGMFFYWEVGQRD